MADDPNPPRGLSAHLHVSLRALARGDAEIMHLISRITGEEPDMEVVDLDDEMAESEGTGPDSGSPRGDDPTLGA